MLIFEKIQKLFYGRFEGLPFLLQTTIIYKLALNRQGQTPPTSILSWQSSWNLNFGLCSEEWAINTQINLITFGKLAAQDFYPKMDLMRNTQIKELCWTPVVQNFTLKWVLSGDIWSYNEALQAREVWYGCSDIRSTRLYGQFQLDKPWTL